MVFYDAHLTYGAAMNLTAPLPKLNVFLSMLDDELDRTGVTGGLVYNCAIDYAGVVVGNGALANDLKTARHELYGVYTLVPSYTNELPKAEMLYDAMKVQKMGALRLHPKAHGFIAKAGILSDYLSMAQECHIPVILDTACGLTPEDCWDFMCAYPDLTSILSIDATWPTDRMVRPFLAQFKNLYYDLSHMITEHGLESLVSFCGAERLLFASDYPARYIGGQQMMLKYSLLSEEEKDLIAGENLLRLLREAKL